MKIEWTSPDHTNGPIKHFEIVASYDGGKNQSDIVESALATEELFDIECPKEVQDFLLVNYTVRAVTHDPFTDQLFYGPFSDPVGRQMCKPVKSECRFVHWCLNPPQQNLSVGN